MRFRTIILILLLISQPVSAFSGSWHSMQPDHGAAPATSHCDDNAGAVHEAVADTAEQPADNATGEDASDSNCDDNCNLCAACAVATTAAQLTLYMPVVTAPVSEPRVLLLTGNTDLLYRPPITS